LHLHHSRQLLVGQRTALINHMRGTLMEFGITVPIGPNALRRRLPAILEDADNELPMLSRHLLATLAEQFRTLDDQIELLEHQLDAWHRSNENSQRLAEVPGIGLLTATALAAAVGDAKGFRNGRELAAWLGLVPRQHSTGGRQRMLGISKRGDRYLRTLLIHGARAVVRHARAAIKAGQTPKNTWLGKLLERQHPNKTAVALANRNARVAWALLTRQERYQPVAS
jgi:transposase